ncbi:MAG: enoyl-CoA hydratase/isomerase family protein [Alphaproteobacteria bacterium]|nr:enoyl-CoA hydratase/isomerase family protein [Alphaproteobacteria bacterium]
MAAATDPVLIARDGGIVTVTLNRPEKLNALDTASWDRVRAAFESLDADGDVRCVILTGAGGKAFCVGADIAEFDQVRSSADKARAYAKRIHPAIESIASCRHPVVAAVRGLCVGGGLELACMADLRICGESSRFGIPVKRLGLVVAYAELRPLVHLVGPANAKQILLEGEIFGAGEALRMGLVNRAVPDARFDEEVLAMARRIAEGAPLVARWHKKFTDRLLDPRPLTPAEDDESYHCFDTEDFQAGRKAFLAKVAPQFKGR